MPHLAPPTAPGAAVTLDPSQDAVLDAVREHRVTLAVGAPGTGRTTLAVAAAVRAVTQDGIDPARVLVLAASRRGAAQLRARTGSLAERTTSTPMVRTAASAAFAVLRTRAAALGAPSPTLITGPEQDLVLADLLAGHVDGDAPPLDLPPGLSEDVLGLRGLRQELRDLLMRAAERGIDPVELDALGRSHDRPEWRTAAQLYEEYLDVLALRGLTPDSGARYDPAVVVDEATAGLAAWDDEVPGAARPTWDLVVVDDYQEATVATAGFLRRLHDDGARLLLLADPDSAVQGFRGAVPALVGRASAPLPRGADVPWQGELGAHTVVLGTAWRQPPALRAVTRAVTQEVATVSGAAHRAADPRPDVVDEVAGEAGGEVDGGAPTGGPPAGPRVAVLGTAAQEAAFVARELRVEHLLHGTPWDRMAVIARSGTQLAAVRRALLSASVPVATLGSDVPLRDEPAVSPLLAAVRVAVSAASGTPALDPETAVALMTSPLGGTDVVALRRLRRALRAEELAGGGGRASDALLVEVLLDPVRAGTLPSTVQRGVVAVASVLAAATQAAAEPTADAQSVLWAAWDAARLADRWRAAALAGGPAGARADRDLDSVLALFRAAETFVERMPGAPPLAFVDYLDSQDLPADSLAATATGGASVAALTPAGAAGREWDVVVVVGVQDGSWPDLRLRDSLLGSQVLVDLVAGRTTSARGLGPDARRAVLGDELRSFAVATSRATRRLLVTATDDGEDVPSPFCDLVDGGPDHGSPDDGGSNGGGLDGGGSVEDPEIELAARRRATVGQPLDLRGVVAGARAVLVADEVAGERSPAGDQAAALLARLGGVGVLEADPERWYAVHDISTDAALWAEDETVTVSPSKVESVSRCALRWALETGGATAADATAQTIGNLVHSIAQERPAGAHHELAAELDRRWPELGLVPGWPATAERRHADLMIERLAGYFKVAGEAVLVEAPFRLEVGRAVLRGIVDRVERDGEDGVRVVDLKTGRRKPTVAEAEENPQLGAYQLAVDGAAFEDLPEGTRSAGAQLVFLGDGKNHSLRTQKALDVDVDGTSWARTLVEDVADTMAASVFTAHQNSLCGMCPVRRSCPAQPEGRQVIA